MNPLTDYRVVTEGAWVDLPVAYLGGPPATSITHGRQLNAGNTGLNYIGIDPGSLDSRPGYQNFTTPGEVIEGYLFNDRVDLNGVGSIMRNCMFVGGGLDHFGAVVWADDVEIVGVNLHAGFGISWYIGVQITDGAHNTKVRRCDLSGAKSQIATYGIDALIQETYSHDTSLLSDPTNHPDNIEVYGGSCEFDRCNLPMGAIKYDATINIAPFGGRTVPYVDIHDCVLDGGQAHILASGTTPPDIASNIRVRRNDMGGHTNPDTNLSFGEYMAASYWPLHGLCEDETEQAASGGVKILWPSFGPDANYWRGCSDLTPDRSGTIAYPRT